MELRCITTRHLGLMDEQGSVSAYRYKTTMREYVKANFKVGDKVEVTVDSKGTLASIKKEQA